jgi:hypothetical protein
MNTKASAFAGRTILLSISALALGLVAGCKSTSYDKGDAAGQSLSRAALEVQAESRALDRALQTLSNLANNPSRDLKLQFEQYDGAVDALYRQIERAHNAIKEAREKNAAYLKNWEQQLGKMNYESVRDYSATRRTVASNQVETVIRRYQETQEAALPVLAYLEDIRKALDSELTADGLSAVKNLVNNADRNGRKVQTALANAADDLATAGRRMSPTVPVAVSQAASSPASARVLEK